MRQTFQQRFFVWFNRFLLSLVIFVAAGFGVMGAAGCGDEVSCGDADGDSVCDENDVCSLGDDRMDEDGDGVPDACDVCPGGDDGVDGDGDGIPDACDLCDGVPDGEDLDGDGVPQGCDICPNGDDTQDADGDGVPDACDVCPGHDDAVDTDGDGVPNGCDVCDGDNESDADGDGVPDACDICPDGDDALDADGDGVPDACDICPDGDDALDADGDGVPDACDECAGADDNADDDGDGVADGCDICPGEDDGLDTDGDGTPDGCDICPGEDDDLDTDGDGVPNGCDICAEGDDGVDTDGDGTPDGCDICPGEDDGLDTDGDGTPDGCDICPGEDDDLDTDGDGTPDGCDICPGEDDDLDTDGDGVPDGCDVCQGGDDNVDTDGDGVPDACDLFQGCADGVDNDGDGAFAVAPIPNETARCDCDDQDELRYPGKIEACNGYDDNCNGLVDHPDEIGVAALVGYETILHAFDSPYWADGVPESTSIFGFVDEVTTANHSLTWFYAHTGVWHLPAGSYVASYRARKIESTDYRHDLYQEVQGDCVQNGPVNGPTWMTADQTVGDWKWTPATSFVLPDDNCTPRVDLYNTYSGSSDKKRGYQLDAVRVQKACSTHIDCIDGDQLTLDGCQPNGGCLGSCRSSTTLTFHGGTGGVECSDDARHCADGWVAVGVRSQVGDWADMLTLICRPVVEAETLGESEQLAEHTCGGTGGNPVDSRCDAVYADGVMIGQIVHIDTAISGDVFVRGMGVVCARLSDGTTYEVDNTSPPSTATRHQEECPVGTHVYSLEIHSGSLTDGVAAVCSDRHP